MRTRARSLASLSGLWIWRCHELWCRSQTCLGSGVASNCSSILPLAWELPICCRWGPKKQKKKKKSLTLSFLFLLSIPRACWKFLSQGLNPFHNSDLSHCSDDAGSLICWTTREIQITHFYAVFYGKQMGRILLNFILRGTKALNPFLYSRGRQR